MYIYMYMDIYIYMYIYIYIYIHVYIVYMNRPTGSYIRILLTFLILVRYVYTYIHICIYKSADGFIHMNTFENSKPGTIYIYEYICFYTGIFIFYQPAVTLTIVVKFVTISS
jgi:hypothetical protein